MLSCVSLLPLNQSMRINTAHWRDGHDGTLKVWHILLHAQAPLRDFPCAFARMRECDALCNARKCSSSANGCNEPHCGNDIMYEMLCKIAHALSQKKFRILNFFTIAQARNLAKLHKKTHDGARALSYISYMKSYGQNFLYNGWPRDHFWPFTLISLHINI